MCFDNLLTLMGLERQRQNDMSGNLANIAIGMIFGVAVGTAITYCWCENSNNKGFRMLKKKSSETFENVMDAADTFQQKAKEVKENIQSGYENIKKNVEDSVDKASDMDGDFPD